jgi:hypothetical protein
MKKRAMNLFSYFLVFSILMSTMGLLVPEISAALQGFNYLGEVTAINGGTSEITIETEYTRDGQWVLTISAPLTGVAPNDAVHGLKVGDYVEAVSLGVPGETWVALGKMKSPEQRTMTDIYGDPAFLISDTLLGDYKVIYENVPDCQSCGGCNCVALYSDVTIKKNNNTVETTTLNPGETDSYEGDEYTIDIEFHSGQAPSYPDCTNEPWMGPQAVSNFTIHASKNAGLCTSGVLLAMIAATLATYWLKKRKKEA